MDRYAQALAVAADGLSNVGRKGARPVATFN
jgi:hypothetical protein